MMYEAGKEAGPPFQSGAVSTVARFDWGSALDVSDFYGREREQALLIREVEQERRRIVSILGMGGIGKSALAISVMYRVASSFQVVLFRSVRDAPPCRDLLADCLQVLLLQSLPALPSSVERRMDLLLEAFQKRRCLLVLDNLETLLQEHDAQGRYHSGYEDYGTLLRRIAATAHQSCVLLTSRENAVDLEQLESNQASVRSLRLTGLEEDAGEQLLADREVAGTASERAKLIEMYAGNPLALKIVAETIAELFGGAIGPFLEEGGAIFSSIRHLLAEQFARLSAVEQSLLAWLAVAREPLDVDELCMMHIPPIPREQVIEAVEALQRRSLIERGKQQAIYTLQSVVMEFVTEVLVEQICTQMQQGELEHLVKYALAQARAKEYVRQAQERLVVAPLITQLYPVYRRASVIEARLLGLLDQLREREQEAQGYGPANLITLLRELRGHLRGIDLSHLAIRNAYFQGIEMQDATLAGAIALDTVFTETFDATWAVAISRKGTFWAAGSRRGEVRVWHEEGKTLHLVWQAHADNVMTLAFSPDERTLATGSWDGTVKLWALANEALLLHEWQASSINTVAFAPAGRVLASGGDDGRIQLWDVQTGANLYILPAQGGALYALAWSPDGRLFASGGFDGLIRLWEMQADQPPTCIRVLAGHTNWVAGLAFAPAGAQLASVSFDRTARLWDVTGGRLLQTLTGHTEWVRSVAWSPDGRTVATAGNDETIWLWDVERGSYRLALHGHTADIYYIAFTPDSRNLLSGSEDSTLRVWDVERGQCVRIIQSHAYSLYDVVWSPDGTQLATGGTDTLLTIWDESGRTAPRVLRGHNWIVHGVAWSPDGRLLASSGWDNAIRLWDPASGACLHLLRNPDSLDTIFQGIAWSPDGRLLAAGSYLRGVHVWDVHTRSRRWVSHPSLIKMRRVAWSPDSTRLASSGDDGSIYMWAAADGTLLQRLQGPQGMIASIAWSPDGTQLVSGGGSRGSGELYVWDAGSGKCIWALSSLPGTVFAVAWSADGMLVSGGSDGMLRWWEVQKGECIRVREAHRGMVQALRVSPAGAKLASCGDDGAIMLWNLHNGEHLRTLRRDRPYERLNITGIRGLTEAQKTTLRALGAIEEATNPL